MMVVVVVVALMATMRNKISQRPKICEKSLPCFEWLGDIGLLQGPSTWSRSNVVVEIRLPGPWWNLDPAVACSNLRVVGALQPVFWKVRHLRKDQKVWPTGQATFLDRVYLSLRSRQALTRVIALSSNINVLFTRRGL